MTTAEMKQTKPETAPASAFRFGCDNVIFASESDGQSAPLEMLARTGDPIQHWFWGSICHDFAGMRHRASIPVDYEHRSGEPIGYIDTFEIRDGDLYLLGSIESLAKGDEADKLMRRKERGIPYQASIFFDPEDLSLEFVPEGFQAQANGRTIEGPAVIVREWQLRGVAITPHGADVGTESSFSASVGAFSLNWQELNTMPKTTTKPQDAENKTDVGELSADDKQTETKPEPKAVKKPAELKQESDGMEKARQMIGLFSDHFGETAGAQYFREGLNLTEAALKHCSELSKQIESITEDRDRIAQKLAAAQLEHGEREPVNTGTPDSKQKPTAASLFRKAGSAS